MSAVETAAADVRPPIKRAPGGTETEVRYFTVTSTNQTHELPPSWHGNFVSFLADVDFWFLIGAFPAGSVSTDLEVDKGVAATAAGASGATVGLKILANTMVHFRMPYRGEGEVARNTGVPTGKLWFARESDVAGNIYAWLSSGK
jgi:hypothetical protein